MLGIEEVAELLGISRATAYDFKRLGLFPPHYQEGHQHVWRKEEVLAWLKSKSGDDGETWDAILREIVADRERDRAETEADPTAADWTPDLAVKVSLGQFEPLLGRLRRCREELEALEGDLRRLADCAEKGGE